MLLVASTIAWVLMEGNDKHAKQEGICTEVSSEPFDYISECQPCLLRWTQCFSMHLVDDEYYKVLDIKCLLLNPIKWISFPFHNIIMSQKPSFSALYIFFSHYKLSWIVLPVTVALLDFTLRQKKNSDSCFSLWLASKIFCTGRN